jgi:hypothetical protein
MGFQPVSRRTLSPVTDTPPETPPHHDPQGPSNPSGAALLHLDLACVGCGYGLLGEPVDAACPQCDAPISQTVRPGDLLLANDRFLNRLRFGLQLVLGGILGQVVVTVALVVGQVVLASPGGVVSAPTWEAVTAVAGVIVAIIIAQGWFIVTEPDAEGRFLIGAKTEAAVVRRAVFAHAVFVGTTLLGQWLAVLPALVPHQQSVALVVAGASLGAFITLCVQFFAVMAYLGHIARGTRDRALAKLVRTRTWSCPLWATVGILLFGLGPLVALVLYYNTISAVRARLGHILQAHRTTQLAITA